MTGQQEIDWVLEDPGVRVELKRVAQDFDLEVRVRSVVRPHVSKVGTKEQVRNCVAREMVHHAAVLAGACAEALCGQYGDTVDPDDCARRAGGLMAELLRRLQKQGVTG